MPANTGCCCWVWGWGCCCCPSHPAGSRRSGVELRCGDAPSCAAASAAATSARSGVPPLSSGRGWACWLGDGLALPPPAGSARCAGGSGMAVCRCCCCQLGALACEAAVGKRVVVWTLLPCAGAAGCSCCVPGRAGCTCCVRGRVGSDGAEAGRAGSADTEAGAVRACSPRSLPMAWVRPLLRLRLSLLVRPRWPPPSRRSSLRPSRRLPPCSLPLSPARPLPALAA